MTTAHYEPLAGYNPMRARARFYIWDADTLEDGPYDVMAMERALNGEPTVLNEAERYETARRLYALLCDEDDVARRNKIIAERVGASDRTVIRWNNEGWRDRNFNPDGSLIDCKATVETIEERFASKTQPTDDGHLIWTGAVNDGAPRFYYQRRSHLAARYAYQQHTGTEPIGVVRPACGNDLCVKGDHLKDRASRSSTNARKQVAA